MSIAGLILAGGASRRMGFPKALLGIGEETFLDRLIRVFNLHLSPVIVVLGHEPERIMSGLARGDEASFVINADYAQGQLSSMKRGLRAMPPRAEAVVFTPVDHPAIQSSTVARLVEEFLRAAGKYQLAIPRYKGRRGHPVCLGRTLLEEVLALPPDGETRQAIRRHVSETLYVDLDDPGVVDDVDDPDAYARLIGGRRTS